MAIVKRVLLALLASLLVGFAIGTALRLYLDRPTVYIGSAIAPLPLDIAAAGAPVLDPGHHEEQVG